MLGLTVAVVSYIVGSFPTAYVIGKYFRRIDLSRSGTGNIGAMNAFAVTGSKVIGISVALIDVLKGFSVAFIFDKNFGLILGLTAALFVVVGHNYSVFMKFRGGRGLAAAAGALLVIVPLAVPVYLAVYFVLRGVGMKLYLSSVIGILFAGAVLIRGVTPGADAIGLSAAIVAVILSKHLLPLINEIKNA